MRKFTETKPHLSFFPLIKPSNINGIFNVIYIKNYIFVNQQRSRLPMFLLTTKRLQNTKSKCNVNKK